MNPNENYQSVSITLQYVRQKVGKHLARCLYPGWVWGRGRGRKEDSDKLREALREMQGLTFLFLLFSGRVKVLRIGIGKT